MKIQPSFNLSPLSPRLQRQDLKLDISSLPDENELSKYCDGLHHTDEILCEMGKDLKDSLPGMKLHYFFKG